MALTSPSSLVQHYPERHGGPERHGRDSRDGWGYGSNKRMSEGRGLPPPPRFVSCPPTARPGGACAPASLSPATLSAALLWQCRSVVSLSKGQA